MREMVIGNLKLSYTVEIKYQLSKSAFGRFGMWCRWLITGKLLQWFWWQYCFPCMRKKVIRQDVFNKMVDAQTHVLVGRYSSSSFTLAMRYERLMARRLGAWGKWYICCENAYSVDRKSLSWFLNLFVFVSELKHGYSTQLVTNGIIWLDVLWAETSMG